LEHDKAKWKWDLLEQAEKLGLNDYQRYRLVNYIRRKVRKKDGRSLATVADELGERETAMQADGARRVEQGRSTLLQ
jgi:ribosomal 50S subunit-associated protein YjgA (DUF615 family)